MVSQWNILPEVSQLNKKVIEIASVIVNFFFSERSTTFQIVQKRLNRGIKLRLSNLATAVALFFCQFLICGCVVRQLGNDVEKAGKFRDEKLTFSGFYFIVSVEIVENFCAGVSVAFDQFENGERIRLLAR